MLCVTPPALRHATVADYPAIVALLTASNLPTADIESARPLFIVAVVDSRIVGAGALQLFGASALLRSMAVAQESRGSGVGASLYSALSSWLASAAFVKLGCLLKPPRRSFSRTDMPSSAGIDFRRYRRARNSRRCVLHPQIA